MSLGIISKPFNVSKIINEAYVSFLTREELESPTGVEIEYLRNEAREVIKRDGIQSTTRKYKIIQRPKMTDTRYGKTQETET